MKRNCRKIILIFTLLIAVIFVLTVALVLKDEAPQKESEVVRLTSYEPKEGEKIVYGYSGMGRELLAYRFGDGANVLILTFCVHGYEDCFPRDGAALVYTANLLMDEIPAWDISQWSIYVLPCCNPDGLLEGVSRDGFGRCTAASYRYDGLLSFGMGADINRCFPVCWEPLDEPRFYNGSEPLACPEAAALAEFFGNTIGGGMNFSVDVHGWYQQILTSSGKNSVLYKVFSSEFPENTWADVNRGTGYLAAYSAVLGYDSVLFEFPSDITGMDSFVSSGYAEDFIRCIRILVNG